MRFGLTPDHLSDWALPGSMLRRYVDQWVLDDPDTWLDAGIGPRAAAEFAARRANPPEALSWLQSGCLPSEFGRTTARSSHPDGFDRSSVLFSEVFRRHKGTLAFTVRDQWDRQVQEVVDSLAVPVGPNGAAFLDGGMLRRGWPWVVGTSAARFVCARLGIQQPRKLKGEGHPAVLADMESQMLGPDWEALDGQLVWLPDLARLDTAARTTQTEISTTDAIGPPSACGMYRPGHQVHWIQWKRYWHSGSPRFAGRLLGADADGTITIGLDHGVRHFWNHDHSRLRQLAHEAGDELELSSSGGLLGIVASGGETCLFSLGDPKRHQTCWTPPA